MNEPTDTPEAAAPDPVGSGGARPELGDALAARFGYGTGGGDPLAAQPATVPLVPNGDHEMVGRVFAHGVAGLDRLAAAVERLAFGSDLDPALVESARLSEKRHDEFARSFALVAAKRNLTLDNLPEWSAVILLVEHFGVGHGLLIWNAKRARSERFAREAAAPKPANPPTDEIPRSPVHP